MRFGRVQVETTTDAPCAGEIRGGVGGAEEDSEGLATATRWFRQAWAGFHRRDVLVGLCLCGLGDDMGGDGCVCGCGGGCSSGCCCCGCLLSSLPRHSNISANHRNETVKPQQKTRQPPNEIAFRDWTVSIHICLDCFPPSSVHPSDARRRPYLRPQIYNLLKSMTDKHWQRAKNAVKRLQRSPSACKASLFSTSTMVKTPYTYATRKTFNSAGEGGNPEIQPSRSITQSQRFCCKARKAHKVFVDVAAMIGSDFHARYILLHGLHGRSALCTQVLRSFSLVTNELQGTPSCIGQNTQNTSQLACAVGANTQSPSVTGVCQRSNIETMLAKPAKLELV